MGLKDKFAEDMKQAMKSGEKTRLETLRTLKAALMEREIQARGDRKELTAGDELAVVMTMAKKRKESIELFTKGGRLDLAAQEQLELNIIQEYLPKMMTTGEIAEVIERTMASTGATAQADFAKVMPLVMKEVKGRADGKLVQELVRKRLEGATQGG